MDELPNLEETVERSPTWDLSGKQRKTLRGFAHHMQPLIRVGRDGLDEGVANATSEALEQHELIKVKLLESATMSAKEAGEWLAKQCGAHLVGRVGRIAILYRRRPKNPEIPLRR